QFAIVRVDALPAQRLEVLEDALHSRHALFLSLHAHGVGAKIDADAELVFHEPEIFIASPKEGLEVGRDLQSDLQRIQCPPRGRAVEVDKAQGRPAARWTGCGQTAECAENLRARCRVEPKLWAEWRNRGME